ncbi:MAG: carboxy terminal-processing peptidase [Planctomycetota bacterium]
MKNSPARSETPHRRTPVRVVLGAVLVAAVTLAGYRAASARPTKPSENARRITLGVRMLIEQGHVSQQRINDQMSERCLNKFLETLDPWKLYFYQSDVDEFRRNRFNLDDMLKRDDVSFAYTVFSRFLARVDERVATALAQVDAPHDFTDDESMIRDRDATTYPRTPEEAVERWRKRVKYDLLIFKSEEMDDEEAKTKLRKRYSGVGKRWRQTNDDDLLELFLTSMALGFDPHSTYMSPSTLDDFNLNLRLELDGIGASLSSEDGYTEVREVIAGGAADGDGRLKVGDQIIGVGQGTAGPIEDIIDMRLRDVVKLIRGKRGTIVRLQVKPVDSPKESVVYQITRAQVKLKSQEARSVVVPWGTKPNGQPYRLGVINLPGFYADMEGARNGDPNYKSCARDVRRLLNQFNRMNADPEQPDVDAVVMDLRFNGGGSLQDVIEMTGMFIDQGPVVQVKGPDGQAFPRIDPEPGIVWSGPLVVMTNMFSASASEIFAGAIQDYGRGVVIGDRSTHGKGTVQQVFDLGRTIFSQVRAPKLGAFKLTIQQFYRPDGDSTQNRGVVADVTIPALTGHLEGIAEADLDYPLAFDQVRRLEHDRFGMISLAIAAQLQANSDQRVTQSEDFQKDTKRIQLYEEQKDDPTITLNLEQYLAEQEQLDTDKEKKEIGEKISDSDRPVFDTESHYNQEALAITIDYLRLLKEKKVAVAR